FLTHRDLREGFYRLLHVLAPENVAAEVACDVGDEAHAEVGYDLVGRRRGHHDLGSRQHLFRRVLREWTLVEPVADRRRGSPVVTVPVVGRKEGPPPPAREAGSDAGPHSPEESPAISHAPSRR